MATPPRRRFRFTLPALLAAVAVIGFLNGLGQSLLTDKSAHQTIVSMTMWYLGAIGTVVLVSLGYALGERRGAILAAPLGGVVWFLALWLVETFEGAVTPMMGMHAFVILVITVVMSRSVMSAGGDEPSDDNSSTTGRLIETKRRLKESEANLSDPAISTNDLPVEKEVPENPHGGFRHRSRLVVTVLLAILYACLVLWIVIEVLS